LSTTNKNLIAFIVTIFLTIFSAQHALAQDETEKMPAPDFVTIRVFEARVPLGKGDLTDQLFKLRTASQTSDEGWLNNLRKAYPGVEMFLLKTSYFRLFKSPKKGVIEIGNPDSAHTEVQAMTAYSIGDGTTPGTTLILEVNDYGDAKAKVAIAAAVASQGIEAETGMTYFFTNDRMKIELPDYTKYMHDGFTSPVIEKSDHFFIVAASVEKEKQPGFMTDSKVDAALMASAIKKPAIQIPADLKGIWGKVVIRAEVSTDGKLKSANIWSSTAPELNQAALAAARQYEFAPQKEALTNIPIIFSIAAPVAKAGKTAVGAKKVIPAVGAKKPMKK
jgi:TonB family protein